VAFGDGDLALDAHHQAGGFAGELVDAQECSGMMVFGSQSPNSGPSHFHARGQSSRLSCSLVQTMPLVSRSALRSAIARW
jgi:hypothetical protein